MMPSRSAHATRSRWPPSNTNTNTDSDSDSRTAPDGVSYESSDRRGLGFVGKAGIRSSIVGPAGERLACGDEDRRVADLEGRARPAELGRDAGVGGRELGAELERAPHVRPVDRAREAGPGAGR